MVLLHGNIYQLQNMSASYQRCSERPERTATSFLEVRRGTASKASLSHSHGLGAFMAPSVRRFSSFSGSMSVFTRVVRPSTMFNTFMTGCKRGATKEANHNGMLGRSRVRQPQRSCQEPTRSEPVSQSGVQSGPMSQAKLLSGNKLT